MAKADVSLKEMEAGAGDVSKALNKMLASFDGSKVIKDAQLATKAVEAIGGATKLTEDEQAKLNAQLTEAIAKYKALGIEAPKAMVDLEAATRKIQPPSSAFVDYFKGAVAGMLTATAVIGTVKGAIRGLSDFVSSSVDAYAQQETAIKKMTVALQAQGTATPAVIQQYNNLASSFQKTTAFGDDLINEMQALLTEVGNVMPRQMEGALKASTDLSVGLGIDLRDATILVAKAFEGNTTALKKYGIAINDTEVQAKGAQAVLDAIQDKFGGQAQAEIETYAGRVKQLANAWGEVKEALGKSIVTDPLLIASLNLASKAVNEAANSAGDASPSFLELWASFAGADQSTQTVIALAEQLTHLYQVIERAPKSPDIISPTGLNQFGTSLIDVNKYLKEWEEKNKKAKAAAEEHAKAVKELKDAMIPLTEAQKASVLLFDQQGSSAQTMAKAMNISATAIQNFLTSVQEDAKSALDDYNESIRRHNELQREGEEASLAAIAKQEKEQFEAAQAALDDYNESVRRHKELQKEGEDATLAALNKQAKEASKFLSELAQSFAQLAQISGSSFGSILRDIGALISMLDAADKASQKFGGDLGIASALFSDSATATEKWASALASSAAIANGVMSVWASTANDGSKAAAGFHGALSGAQAGAAFGPWGAAIGAAGGALLGFIHTLSAGRREVESFAQSFDTAAAGGGFDELRKKLLVLGDEGERLWIKLTQGTKKGDKKGAQAVEDEIRAALDAFEKNKPETATSIEDDAAAMGFKTQDALQAMADKAKAVYEYMASSGKYSAEQVQKAWEAAQEALATAGDATAIAAKKNRDALKDLDDQYKSLADSIAGEAPEEFMGVVERQARERMAQIEEERKKIQTQIEEAAKSAADANQDQVQDQVDAAKDAAQSVDDLGGKLDDNVQDWKDWGGDVSDQLRSVADMIRNMPIPSPAGSLPFSAGSAGSSKVQIVAPVYLDGNVVAENTSYHLLN